VVDARGGEGVADRVPEITDRPGCAGSSAKRRQLMDSVLIPEDGSGLARDVLCPAGNQAGSVDGEGPAASTAQRAQVGELAQARAEEPVVNARRRQCLAHDEPLSVDGPRPGEAALQRAEDFDLI